MRRATEVREDGKEREERAERVKMRDQSVCSPAEGGQGGNILEVGVTNSETESL